MPRGVRKTVDIEAQLKLIDGKIAELEAQREDLLQKKREYAKQKLVAFVTENSIPLNEAIETLTAAVAASAETGNTTELV